MAEGEIEVGLGVDLTGASPQIQKFSKQIGESIADLRQLASAAELHIDRLTTKLNKAYGKAKFGSQEQMTIGRQLERVKSQGYSSIGRDVSSGILLGSTGDAARTEALTKRAILRINTEYEQAEARIRQARLSAIKRGFTTSDPYLVASAVKAERDAAAFVRRQGSPALVAAQGLRSTRADQDAIREAQVGRGSAGMERTLDRLGSNGGANLAAIQTKVLVGYQAITASFNAIKGASSFVIGLDKEFRQFQAITATTNKEMEGLEKRLISVSEQTKFTALEVASAATTMGQAGLSAAEVANAIEAVTLLATAAGTQLAPAVDLVTSTLSIFNLQTSQTTDIANTMTAAINGSKLTIDKLALGFQYAGNIAAQMGVTYTELTATLGALANSGIKSGSTLGTGLRQLLVDIATPTEKFSRRLHQLGLVQADIDVKSRGLVAVLKTLKEAGFGGAEAFESFEVRAAAAYTALSNNLDVQAKLQKQFVLSNASAEANAIQMESLANTFAKLQSVMGTIVYKAFRPFIDVMQQLANAAANTLSILNRMPFLLEGISVALVGIGVGVTATAFSALFRALGAGLPLFATYTAATTALVTANTAAAVTTTALTRTLVGLFAVMKAHPFVLAISAVAALATAYKAFGRVTEDVLDNQNALIATLEGQAEETRTQLEAIDQTVTDLIMRKAELDKDPILREAKILEVIQQFKELGGSIDSTTSSVQDLVEALGHIKEIDFGQQIETLELKLQAIAANIQLIKAEDAKKAADYKPALANSAIANLTNEQKRKLIDEGLLKPGRQGDLITSGFEMSFPGNPFVGQAADFALGRTKPTASEASGLSANLNNLIKRLQFESRHVDLDPAKQRVLAEQISSLSDLSSEVNLRLMAVIDLEKNLSDLDITRSNRDRAVVREDLIKSGLDGDIQSARTFFTTKVEETERYVQNPKTSVAEAAKATAELKKAKDAFDERMKKDIENWVEATLMMFSEISPTTVDAAVQEAYGTGYAHLTNRIDDAAIKAAKNAAELNEAAQDAYSTTLEKSISTRMKLVSNSTSREDVKKTEEWIKERLGEKRDIINSLYDSKVAQEIDRVAIEKLEAARQQALAQIEQEQTGLIETLNQQIISLVEKMYKDAIGVTDRNIDVLTKNLKDLEGEIKKAKPGEMMDKLIRKYNQMIGTLSDALDSKESLETGLGAYTSPASDRSSYLSKVVGAESSGDAHAQAKPVPGTGIMPTAGGLGGFTNGTWLGVIRKHFPQLAANQSEKQLLALKYNRDFHMKVLDLFTQDNEADLTSNGIAVTDGSRYLSHFLGQNNAKRVLRADPSTPIEQLTGADQRSQNPSVFKNVKTAGDMVGWANRKMGGTASTNSAATIQETKESLADAIYEGTTRAMKLEVAANVKANRAQIAGRTAASAGGSTGSIAENMNAIDAMFDKIVAERVREFEQVNMKALASGDEETKAQLQDLKDQLNSERSSKLTSLVDDYQKAAEDVVSKPLEEARAKLAAAQDPNNRGKFSIPEINKLKADVEFLEREQSVNSVSVAEQKLVLIRGELAEATKRSGENSEEAIAWLQQEALANRELEAALLAVGIIKDAQSKGLMTQQGAFDGAVTNWQLNSGFMKLQGKDAVMLSAAEQMEQVWGQVLDTLSSGFSQFFTDLASGTMTAGQAFKNFALTVIQSFIDMIAKALAFQMVQQMIGMAEGVGGGGFLGKIMSSVFTVPGKAANGELITGGSPNRDSVLRQVMPGEMILRKSAVDAIGADKLVGLNNMGNRTLSTTAPEAMMGQGGGNGMVNVYVVSKDNLPPMGPNDIIATIADDVNRKGTIRQLIKSVQMGAV